MPSNLNKLLKSSIMPYVKGSIGKLCERSEIIRAYVAKNLGVSLPRVYEWENGTKAPNTEKLDMLYKLARRHEITDIEFYEKP